MWWTVAKEAATNWSGHMDDRQGATASILIRIFLWPYHRDRRDRRPFHQPRNGHLVSYVLLEGNYAIEEICIHAGALVG